MKHLVENFLLLSVLLVTLFIGGCQKDLTIEPDLSTAREDTDSLSTQSYCAFEGDNHYSALRYLYMDLKYRDFRYDFIQSIPKSTGTPIWDLTVIDYKKEGMFGLLPFVNEQNEVSAIMTFRSYKDEPIAYTLISTEQMKAVMDKATESYQDFDLVYTYYIWMNAYNFGMNGKLDKDAEYYVNLYKQISGSGKTDDFFPLLDELIDLLKRLLGGGGGGGPTEDVHDPSDKCPKFGQYQSTHGSGSGGNNGNSGSGSGDTYLYIGGLGFISYSFGSSDNGTGTSGGGGSSSTNSSDQTTEWLVWQIINYYVGTGEYTYQDVLNPMYQDPNSPHLYYNDNDYTTDPTFNIELIAEAYDPCFFFVCEEDNEEEVSISQNFWSSFDEYIFFEAQKYVLQKYGLDLPPYLLFQIVDDIDCIGVSEANGEIDTACIDAAMQGFLLQQIGISGETNCFYSKPQVWESLRVYLKQNVLDIDIPENTSSAYALSFFSEDIQLIGRFYLEGICDSHYNKDIGMFYADMLAFYDTEFDWINNPSELGDVIAVIDNNGCFNGEYLDEECFWGPYATQVYDELLVLYPELSGIDISSYTATVESSKQLITATKLYDAQHLYGNWNVPDEETMLFYMEMLKVAVKEVFGIVIPFIPYIGDAADIYLSCQNGLNFECTFAVAGLFFTDEFTNFFKPSTYNKIKTVWKLSIQFEVLKQAWKALKNTGLRTDIHLWLPRVSQWIDEGIEFVESGAKVIIKKGGDDVAEIVNDILHVKYTGFGGDVVCHSSKTTSVIGKWNPPGGTGTKDLIESGLTKSGDNPAGVNVLNDLTNTQGWSPQQVWDNINQPWLDDAIGRGDVIRAVSNPLSINNVFSDITDIPTSVFSSPQSLSNYLKNLSNPETINKLSFYGREIRHLSQSDYIFDTTTNLFLK